jgi:hypothetical protein
VAGRAALTDVKEGVAMSYLRVAYWKWDVELTSDEAQEAIQRIRDEGIRVFQSQPGFVRYRLIKVDSHTTIGVVEWESQELGKAGAQQFREWLKSSGIAQKASLETYDGDVLVSS